MEVHREIMQYLDVKDLLSFSNVNQSVRAILHALPATEIEDLTREWYDWFQDNCGHDIWGRLDNWDVFYILERDHQDLLTAGDLIPCYGCAMCHPSADFGDWAIKRLTEINEDGVPLQGCCYDEDNFHKIFQGLMAREATGQMVRTPERLDRGKEGSYQEVTLQVLYSR
jgi:hypothetical protein